MRFMNQVLNSFSCSHCNHIFDTWGFLPSSFVYAKNTNSYEFHGLIIYSIGKAKGVAELLLHGQLHILYKKSKVL